MTVTPMTVMKVMEIETTITVITMPVIRVITAVIAAPAAEAEVYADTSFGFGGADGGSACSNSERGSSSHKGFLQHDVTPIFSV